MTFCNEIRYILQKTRICTGYMLNLWATTDTHILKTPETLLKTILIMKVVPCAIVSTDIHIYVANAKDIVENYINSEQGRSLIFCFYKPRHDWENMCSVDIYVIVIRQRYAWYTHILETLEIVDRVGPCFIISNDIHTYVVNARDIVENYINSEQGRSL